MTTPLVFNRRLPLWLRLTAPILLFVMAPLGVSVLLARSVAEVAANLGAAEAAETIDTLEKASDRYRELVETTKRLQNEISDRLAKRRDLQTFDPKVSLATILDGERRLEPSLRGIAIIAPDGTVRAQASVPISGPGLRDRHVPQRIATSGDELNATFEVSETLQTEMQGIKNTVDVERGISSVRNEQLPGGFRYAFLAILGCATLAAGVFGVFYGTRLSRRIQALVTTARKVGRGDLEARVQLRGTDEMAELGATFDTMLENLAKARRDLEHQQRMSVWQDVARQLAHEIKNPMTPIQLAVQEAVSQYKGDDPRYAKLLATTREIVEEEIASLGRLVDSFRNLGALPKVERAPLAVGDIVEELRLQPELRPRLELRPPAQPAPVVVYADKLLLKRVLVNLVENGVQAGREAGRDGKVVVSWVVDSKRDAVDIAVEDEGNGVSADNRDKIFEPYFTTKSTGTGLGLAISRKIVIEHGGELAIARERPATGGARFVVSLPLRGPEQSLS